MERGVERRVERGVGSIEGMGRKMGKRIGKESGEEWGECTCTALSWTSAHGARALKFARVRHGWWLRGEPLKKTTKLSKLGGGHLWGLSACQGQCGTCKGVH